MTASRSAGARALSLWARVVGYAVVGAVGGLVLGLVVHPPTAPVAVVEGAFLLALPVTVPGIVVGAIVAGVDRLRSQRR